MLTMAMLLYRAVVFTMVTILVVFKQTTLCQAGMDCMWGGGEDELQVAVKEKHARVVLYCLYIYIFIKSSTNR